MLHHTRTLALLMGLGLSCSAQATVIDFNHFKGQTVLPTSFVEGEYQFVHDCDSNNFVCLRTWIYDPADPVNYQADIEGTTVNIIPWDRTVTLSRVDGGAFDFKSMDLADIYNNGSTSAALTFRFNHTDGSQTMQTVFVDDQPGLQTFLFNEHQLRSVSWENWMYINSGSLQMDNVTVTAVPEASSTAMLLAGLSTMALLGRIQRQRVRPQTRD